MIFYNSLSGLFPNSSLYRELIRTRQEQVYEQTESLLSPPASERQLQCVWADSLWRPAELRSNRNERITVINPGRWNLEAGPDFLDAVLLIGAEQRRVQGDIEIHIRPSDWISHRHSNDPRYNHVIAHVCFYTGKLTPDALPPGAIQISVAESLRENPFFSFDNIDTTAYPHAVIRNAPAPCETILSNWPQHKKAELLESAGEERLRIKTLRMQRSIAAESREQCLYESIMTALGYKQNQMQFHQLARKIPVKMLHENAKESPATAYALLLGVAGLLPAKEVGYNAETKTFIRKLWDHWWKHQELWETDTMQQKDWQLSGLRPQNHPVRRLAAAAAIFSQNRPLPEIIISIPRNNPQLWLKSVQNLFKESSIFEYWTYRLSFSGKISKRATVLLGARRIAAIITNVIIPFLAAEQLQIEPLLTQLPVEQDNSLIRQTAFYLFGRDHNPLLYNTGLRQQGLLQIFYDFCLNTRNGCPECSLASALRKQNITPATH